MNTITLKGTKCVVDRDTITIDGFPTFTLFRDEVLRFKEAALHAFARPYEHYAKGIITEEGATILFFWNYVHGWLQRDKFSIRITKDGVTGERYFSRKELNSLLSLIALEN
ncbi:MAG: hypothetical protein E7B29_11920 [Mixta calida]|nr:hypothetical protein [Mixta calida]